MFRFVHVADLHLDTPFASIHRLSSEVAERLREASLKALDRLVDLAINEEASFVLIAGDVFDGADRGVRAQLAFLDAVRSLTSRDIGVYIVHGNHDPLDGWTAINAWPERAHVFSADDVACIHHACRDGTAVHIHGISYATRDVTENLSLRFRRSTERGIHIGLLHANVGGNGEHGNYAPCTVDDLIHAKMDYWALGHIHQRNIVHSKDPWIVYAGGIQGRSAKPSEQGEKGAYIVEVNGEVIEAPRFVPLDDARFVTTRLPITDLKDIGQLEQQLDAVGRNLVTKHEGRLLLLRVHLEGSGPLYSDLCRPDVLSELLTGLREEQEHGEQEIWWDALRNETRPELDWDQIRGRSDFLSEILKMGDVVAASEESLEAFDEKACQPLYRLSKITKHLPADFREASLAETHAQGLRYAAGQLFSSMSEAS